ncbi:hypothetical protein STTU_0793 [Streptomyces sp. Tu6071]|nr:hypothetical protein STTU_0793 [Streptomyces sp. Tu6071]
MLYVGKYEATPQAVPISNDGSFIVEGERYGKLVRGAGGKFARKESAN